MTRRTLFDVTPVSRSHANTFTALPVDARLLALWLIHHADGEGRFGWSASVLKQQIFPHDAIDVAGLLDMLRARGLIMRYTETEGALTSGLRDAIARRCGAAAANAAGSRLADGIVLRAQIWGPCLDWLAANSDRSRARLRALLGKWCREAGDAAVLATMQQAARAAPADPVAWIACRLGVPRDPLTDWEASERAPSISTAP